MFCRVLLPGIIKNSTKHSYVVPIYLFLQAFSLSKCCNYTIVLTQLQLGRIPVLFYQRSDFHKVVPLSIGVDALSVHMLTVDAISCSFNRLNLSASPWSRFNTRLHLLWDINMYVQVSRNCPFMSIFPHFRLLEIDSEPTL